MNTSNTGIAVVVPAFNEGTVIGNVVSEALRFAEWIIVVDDGSRDETAVAARTAGAEVIRHPINLGQGAALQTGITWAVRRGARYIVTFDGDGQHDPRDICKLVDELRGGNYDAALGSRFKGQAVGLPPVRRFVLKAARFVNYLFTGLLLSDAHNGMRALTAEAAAKIRLRQDGMAHATEIISQIAAAKLRYVEVPVTIRYTEYSMQKGQKLSNSVHIVTDLLIRSLLR